MKQYPLLTNNAARGAFLLALTVMLFLSRDTVYTLAILNVHTAAFLTYGIMAVMGAAFLLRSRGNWKKIFIKGGKV